MNDFLSGSLKLFAVPLLTIVALATVFLVAANLIAGRITALLAENDAAAKTTATLQGKLSSLEGTQGQVSDYAQNLIAALPEKNSSLITLSQAKALASENSLILDNISVGSQLTDANLSHVDVVFDVAGAAADIFNFIASLPTVAPIGKLAEVKITGSALSFKANISLTSYWAPLPTKIPAVSDPLQKITPEEETLLAKIGNLRQPQFLELAPSQSVGRTDPFGQ